MHTVELADPWDFSEVYASLDAFAESYTWSSSENYYLHITTGTHVVQIFDYGVERGMPYIAMEKLVGEALDVRLAARGCLTASATSVSPPSG